MEFAEIMDVLKSKPMPSYKENIKKKATGIYTLFNKRIFEPSKYAEKMKDKNITRNMHILDIGCEDEKFLDYLAEYFGMQTWGINIAGDFSYGGDKGRVKIYKRDIPFEAGLFNIITIISVIHHINPEDFTYFVREVCRVSNGYIYIKDVDLTCIASRELFILQHLLFERTCENYRNCGCTYKYIIDEFAKWKYKPIYTSRVNNFNNTIYIILAKN